MSETYTKLFESITRSSVWLEDDQTLRVWVTMLALADRHGYVGASIGGLAATARVAPEKTREAIARFLAPDPDSRSPEHEGRRIEVADRGWILLNYERFRDMRDEEARKEYERQRKREQRRKEKVASCPPDGGHVPDRPALSPIVPASPAMSRVSAQAEAEHKQSTGKEEESSRATAPRKPRGKPATQAILEESLRTAMRDTPPKLSNSLASKACQRIREHAEAEGATEEQAAQALAAAYVASGASNSWKLLDVPFKARQAPAGARGGVTRARATTGADFANVDSVEEQLARLAGGGTI